MNAAFYGVWEVTNHFQYDSRIKKKLFVSQDVLKKVGPLNEEYVECNTTTET